MRAKNDSVRRLTAVANPSSLGANTLIAGVPNYKIRVLGMLVIASAINTVTVKRGTTALTGDCPLAANGGFTLPISDIGWFETDRGEALNASLTVGLPVAVTITYELIG